MDDIELKYYVRECIKELAFSFKDDIGNYGYEADFHFDLYYILNRKNENFWSTKAIAATIPEEDRKRFDLVIYDPDSTKPEPKIIIEIKCNNFNKDDISHDFNKLTKSIKSGKGIIDRIFLYCGYHADKKLAIKDLHEVKIRLKEQSDKHTNVTCILIHNAAKEPFEIINDGNKAY